MVEVQVPFGYGIQALGWSYVLSHLSESGISFTGAISKSGRSNRMPCPLELSREIETGDGNEATQTFLKLKRE
jgi:hypothetical protein